MKKKGKAAGVDRRKYIRYACKTKLKAILDFNPGPGRKAPSKLPSIVFHKGETALLTNISRNGIALEMDHFLPEGMTLRLAIENPITPPIQTGGRIVWTKKIPEAEDKCALGLAFRYMRGKHRRNLDRLIDFLQSIPD